MYTNHSSPTALESQDRFCAALFELMAQKPFERITITELCRTAGLERITFYRNFDEKSDVIYYYLDRQMTLLVASLPSSSSLALNLSALFTWAYEQRQRLCLLMDGHMTTLLSQALASGLSGVLSANLGLGPSDRLQLPQTDYTPADPYINHAVLGLFCGLLTAWRADQFREPPEKLAYRMLLLLGMGGDVPPPPGG